MTAILKNGSQFLYNLWWVFKSIDDVELHQKGYDPVRYGGISICNDIRGTEIAICGGPFIEYYNMSKSESELLFETIRSKIKVY